MFTQKQIDSLSSSIKCEPTKDITEMFFKIHTDTVALVNVYLFCKRWGSFINSTDSSVRKKVKDIVDRKEPELYLYIESINNKAYGWRSQAKVLSDRIDRKGMIEFVTVFNKVTGAFNVEDLSDPFSRFEGMKREGVAK